MPLLTLTGVTIGYYSYFYKAALTPMIVDATLNNDLGTSLDMITPFQIIITIICVALSVGTVIYRFKRIVVNKQIIHFAIAGVIFTLIFSINDRVSNSFNQHFPVSLYYNLNEYRKLNKNRHLSRINPEPGINYLQNEELNIVFIIGESLRANNLSINGYQRSTTPLLSARKNVISFKNIFSEYTYTNPSVAHILTRADSVHANRAKTEKSFITTFNSCGFYTVWLANQDAAITYYPFMMECDTLIYARPEKSVYTYSDWLDEDLFPSFDQTLNRPEKAKLIILHTIGSHWYYNSHYSDDFSQFTPVTRSKIISQNTAEEIINSYDNSVLYTDFFINSIIEKLQHTNSVVIYLSDHGEALGEDGNWLHANDNEHLKNPACLIWYSDAYRIKNPEKILAISQNQNLKFRTDYLYHSILSAGNIPSKIIDESLNIFSTK
ncbi:MAG: phosphoethanolamine transferase [Paludibacteraceae bacterium]|nr:phosphoethanolamine transferase [Paludibacteraceae bacterium]